MDERGGEMLLQFNFGNFRSFKDDTTLDLTAAKISEYSNHITTIGNEKVLPVAAIFGANASGKTNVLEAFRYMTEYVIDSFAYGGAEKHKKDEFAAMKPTPFLFDSNSSSGTSSFEVFFASKKSARTVFYNYGFTVDRHGVSEEWLNYKAKSSRGDYKRVIYRNKSKLELVGIAPKSRENIEIALEKEVLVVSLGAKLKIEKLSLVRDWFLKNEFADFGHPLENLMLSRQLPDEFPNSKAVQQEVVKFINQFDTSIIGFDIEALEQDSDEKTRRFRIGAIHKMTGSDHTTTIPLRLESAGTLKMFALYPLLKNTLDRGGILFIDELNANLHPLLARLLIITFLNLEINNRQAQLIFTTHDSWHLNSNLLRRDEIWFTEKDSDGVSSLFSLVDFVDVDGNKIRKDEDYVKNYLLGKYGAIPTLKYYDMLRERYA